MAEKKAKSNLLNIDHLAKTVNIENEKLSESFWKKVIKYQFIISIIGMIIGLMLSFLGLILTISGIYPSSEWIFDIIGLKSKISNAAPGVILIVVGLLTIYFSRFKIQSAKKKK